MVCFACNAMVISHGFWKHRKHMHMSGGLCTCLEEWIVLFLSRFRMQGRFSAILLCMLWCRNGAHCCVDTRHAGIVMCSWRENVRFTCACVYVSASVHLHTHTHTYIYTHACIHAVLISGMCIHRMDSDCVWTCIWWRKCDCVCMYHV
jgi:hypothetical protein